MTKTWWDEAPQWIVRDMSQAAPPWNLRSKPVVQYSMWQERDWLVIAHESDDGCVSVQFHPPRKNLPWSYPPPSPERTKSLEMPRELEVA